MTPGPSHLTKTSCICYRRTTLRSAVKKKKKQNNKSYLFCGGKSKGFNSWGKNNNPPYELLQSAKNYGSSEAASSRASHREKNTFTSQLFSRLLKMTKILFFLFYLPTPHRHNCTSVSFHVQVNEIKLKEKNI